METCKLQIILHSAKGLTDVKNFGTMDPYAVVWTDRNGKSSEPRKTEVAKKGASFPVWDCTMEFNAVTSMQNNYTLMIEIKHGGKLLDRDIGQVEVPFVDLLAGDGFGQNVSYPVKTSFGEIKGEIVVSHKFMKQDVKSSVEKENGCPKKKETKRKKKNGMMKRVTKNVVANVATEVALLAGMVGLEFAFESMDDGSDPPAVDQDANEDEYVDKDEDVNEEGYEDEDDVEF